MRKSTKSVVSIATLGVLGVSWYLGQSATASSSSSFGAPTTNPTSGSAGNESTNPNTSTGALPTPSASSSKTTSSTTAGFLANHAGGILGGISSGQTIRVAIALKPTASITTPGKTINIDREDTDVLTKGRHDPCVGVRATPIAEAMFAIVLMDHFMRHRAQNADVVAPFTPIEPK